MGKYKKIINLLIGVFCFIGFFHTFFFYDNIDRPLKWKTIVMNITNLDFYLAVFFALGATLVIYISIHMASKFPKEI